MASQREQIEGWTETQLWDSIANQNPYAASAEAELRRRQAVKQEEALDAQLRAAEAEERAASAGERAADAARDAAIAARRNANYMLASVIVAAISAVAAAIPRCSRTLVCQLGEKRVEPLLLRPRFPRKVRQDQGQSFRFSVFR